MDISYFLQLAHYNQWANEKLYEAVALLSVDDFECDCGVFFKSLQGTLNHILVGDLVWLTRLKGVGRADLRLDDLLYKDFDDLHKARIAQDADIITFCENMDVDFLNTVLHYKSITAGACEAPVKMVLGHVFNHQTHHRGHAHACLSRLGQPVPDIDLIYFTLGH